MTTYQDLQPGQHFYVATKGMRGWFAAEFWMNNEEEDLGPFPEPWESDYRTFDNEADAVERAQELANDNGLPYIA